MYVVRESIKLLCKGWQYASKGLIVRSWESGDLKVTSSNTNSLWHFFIKVTCSVFQFLSEVSTVGTIDREAEAEMTLQIPVGTISNSGMDTNNKALRGRKVYRKSNQNPELYSHIFKLRKITRKITLQ